MSLFQVIWSNMTALCDEMSSEEKFMKEPFLIFSMNHLIRFIKPMILLNWTDLVLHPFTAVRNITLLVENNFIFYLFLTQKATEVVYEQL